MTAFLFIPTTHDARLARRVDFANIATLFTDVEELAPRATPSRARALRAVAMLVILVAMVGDMILLARPRLLATAAATTHQAMIETARAAV